MQNSSLKEVDEKRQGEALDLKVGEPGEKHLYLESYGCAMNFSDSEIIASIMAKEGYSTTKNPEEADLVLINTCSIRDKAEQTVKKRLEFYNSTRKENPDRVVGVLGCMAERLKSKLLEDWKLVDLVVGPDAYRELPNLVSEVSDGKKAVNVILSKEETYADISPVRLGSNGVNAFVSIMRGCDNMCSFCVVPFTRGRERSRDPQSICEEVRQLGEQGYREVTLLGQNVDSYLWYGGGAKKDFYKLPEEEKTNTVSFAELLEMVAEVDPRIRIRFSTSHPKDMGDDVLYAMTRHKNICDYIHLPVQSGSSRVLELMNRGYTKEWYKERIDAIRRIIPGCGISQDIIAGFCSETEEDHQETLELMDYVQYDFGYMYMYSERPNTAAQKKFVDDVPDEVKKRRLQEIIQKQTEHSLSQMKRHLGQVQEVLIEGDSKKSPDQWSGRNSQNATVVFDKNGEKPGDYVMVEMIDCTRATLIGKRFYK